MTDWCWGVFWGGRGDLDGDVGFLYHVIVMMKQLLDDCPACCKRCCFCRNLEMK